MSQTQNLTLDERFNQYLAHCQKNGVFYDTGNMLLVKNLWFAGYTAATARIFERKVLPKSMRSLRDTIMAEILEYMDRTANYALDPAVIERERQEGNG